MNQFVKVTTSTIISLSLAFLMQTASASPTKMYKWVNADGTVEFSQRKPKGVDVDEYQLRGDSRYKKMRDAKSRKKNSGQVNTSSKHQALNLVAKENCSKIRNNLKILKNQKNIIAKDSSGNTKRLNKSQRRARYSLEQQNLADFGC